MIGDRVALGVDAHRDRLRHLWVGILLAWISFAAMAAAAQLALHRAALIGPGIAMRSTLWESGDPAVCRVGGRRATVSALLGFFVPIAVVELQADGSSR